MTAKFGRAWIRKDMPRGAWHYDGEIDLGYGAGLRMAATILTQDPLFDWLAYGGTLSLSRNRLSIIPRDGLRKRFYAVLAQERLRIELDRDGFAAGQPILTDKTLKRIRGTLENRTGDAHMTLLKISLTGQASYAVLQEGQRIGVARPGVESIFELKISKPSTVIELVKQE